MFIGSRGTGMCVEIGIFFVFFWYSAPHTVRELSSRPITTVGDADAEPSAMPMRSPRRCRCGAVGDADAEPSAMPIRSRRRCRRGVGRARYNAKQAREHLVLVTPPQHILDTLVKFVCLLACLCPHVSSHAHTRAYARAAMHMSKHVSVHVQL